MGTMCLQVCLHVFCIICTCVLCGSLHSYISRVVTVPGEYLEIREAAKDSLVLSVTLRTDGCSEKQEQCK